MKHTYKLAVFALLLAILATNTYAVGVITTEPKYQLPTWASKLYDSECTWYDNFGKPFDGYFWNSWNGTRCAPMLSRGGGSVASTQEVVSPGIVILPDPEPPVNDTPVIVPPDPFVPTVLIRESEFYPRDFPSNMEVDLRPSDNINATSWQWDFGDGEQLTIFSPDDGAVFHIFWKVSNLTYTAETVVTACNDDGLCAQDSISHDIGARWDEASPPFDETSCPPIFDDPSRC